MSDYCNPPTAEDYLNLRMSYPAPEDKSGGQIGGLDSNGNKELKQDNNFNATRKNVDSKGAGQRLSGPRQGSQKLASSLSFELGTAKGANNIAVKNTMTSNARSII